MAGIASPTFNKRERIVSRKLIEQLFSKERHFKHAVDRNRVKRQVREAYRHHKQILTEKVQQAQTLAIAFIWLADERHESATVEKSVKRLLGKVADRL